MTYTDEELLDALREYVAEHDGELPTRTEADEADALPSGKTYSNRFGSWNKALEAVGLTPRTSVPEYSDEELLDTLREFAAENGGEPPTQTEANESDTLPSGVTYHNHFGSWNEAVEAAGFTPRDCQRSPEELLESLRNFNEEHGRPPTADEANDLDTLPSLSTFNTNFGSWNAAIEKAGLTPRDHTPEYSNEELIADLRIFTDVTDTQLNTTAIREQEDMADPATYHNRFGSWNKALEAAGFTPQNRAHSTEELLDAIREFAAENDGEPPTYAGMNGQDSFPNGAVFRNHFGSWNEAIEAAGFTPRNQSYTEQELLDALRDFNEEHGRPPLADETTEYETLPSLGTYTNHFGSWNAAIEKAGFAPRQPRRSEEELLDILKTFNAENGQPPIISEVNNCDALPNVSVFQRQFGSWNEAIEAAGFTPRNQSYTEQELLDALRDFNEEHGRPPITTEISDHNTLPSETAFRNCFGSWNDALEAAGFTPRSSTFTESDNQPDNQQVEQP